MKSLKHFIEESMVNEESVNKKKKTTENAIKAIQGKKTSVKNPIKTLGIMTSDYPDADQRSEEYNSMTRAQRRKVNKKPAKDLRKTLKAGGYVWKDVVGKYGREENSVMIFNIDLEYLERLAKRFDQSSFIFIKINADETANYQYYEKKGKFYNKTKEEHSIELVNGETDLFTRISKDFRFEIPFSFESCRSRLISLILENEMDDVDTYIRRSISAAPTAAYYARKQLYRGKNLD